MLQGDALPRVSRSRISGTPADVRWGRDGLPRSRIGEERRSETPVGRTPAVPPYGRHSGGQLFRLGRSTSQLSQLADDLSERGIALRILNLGIDTGTPSGRPVYQIVAAVAEMERELLIERTNSGLAASRARGRKVGRKREFSPAAVRKAQERYDKGELSATEIARLAGVSRQTLYRYLEIDSSRASKADDKVTAT